MLFEVCTDRTTLKLVRCEQVLFLDSDNVLMRDPSDLFDAAQFRDTGAVLWPDYWSTSVAPQLAAVLALPRGTRLPAGSFESGQMLIHKRRCDTPCTVHAPVPLPFLARSSCAASALAPGSLSISEAALSQHMNFENNSAMPSVKVDLVISFILTHWRGTGVAFMRFPLSRKEPEPC